MLEHPYIKIDNKKYFTYIGGWYNNKLYMDISVIVKDKKESINIAKHCLQDAIYDLNNNKTIYIK